MTLNLFSVGAFLSATLTLFFGLFVLRNKTSDKRVIVFGLLTLAICVWEFFFGLWQLSTNAESALLYLKLLMTGAFLIPILSLHNAYNFEDSGNNNKKIGLVFGYIVTAVLMVYLWTTDSIYNGFYAVNYFGSYSFDFWPKANILFNIWVGLYGILLMYEQFFLFKIYLSSKGIKRERIKYFLIITSLCFLFGLTILPLWYGVKVLPIGIFFISMYPWAFSYLIFKYQFMDVRFVVGRTLIFLLSTIITLGLSFVMLKLIGSSLHLNFKSYFVFASSLILALIIYEPTLRHFENVAARYFYYPLYSYQQVLIDLGKRINNILDIGDLSKEIIATLRDVVRIEKATVVLLENGEPFRLIGNIGFDESKLLKLSKNNFFLEALNCSEKPLVVDEIVNRIAGNSYEKDLARDAQKLMVQADVIVCMPLTSKDTVFGALIFGPKSEGQSYTEQDVSVLSTLSHDISVAFQNAKHYLELSTFNKKLEQKVKDRTEELKVANQKLLEIGQTKSDFISIVSHQLRSPLTVTKGYISLMMEGDYGEIPEDIKKSLQTVYTSNERLISFTNNLLDVKSIEEGKVKFEPQLISFAEVVQSIVNHYSGNSKKNNTIIEFNGPNNLPPVLADKLKLEQVVTNLIDNAIKYSPKGKVTISLESNNGTQTFKVKDTGEGMSKEELEAIFQKFTRGTQGRKVNVKGTGIGLYIVKKFVDLHEGKVWAESEGIGKGSTFYVALKEG